MMVAFVTHIHHTIYHDGCSPLPSEMHFYTKYLSASHTTDVLLRYLVDSFFIQSDFHVIKESRTVRRFLPTNTLVVSFCGV